MPSIVVLSAVRTPYGRLLGSLSELSPVRLGGLAMAEALRRSGIEPDQVDKVIFGNVLGHALHGNPAAAAAAEARLDEGHLPVTVKAGCASGMHAILLATDALAAGAAACALVGGFESSSQAPHLAGGLRRGLRLGGGALLDAGRHDGPSRPRAAAAAEEAPPEALMGLEAGPAKGREKMVVQRDEDPAPPPQGAEPGTPPLADGAAALVLAEAKWAQRAGREALAILRPHAGPLVEWEARDGSIVEIDVTASWWDGLLGRGRPFLPAGLRAGTGPVTGHAAGADGARAVVDLVHRLRAAGGGMGLAIAEAETLGAAAVEIEI